MFGPMVCRIDKDTFTRSIGETESKINGVPRDAAERKGIDRELQ